MKNNNKQLNRETTVKVLNAIINLYGIDPKAREHVLQAISDVKAMDRLNSLPVIRNMLETEE